MSNRIDNHLGAETEQELYRKRELALLPYPYKSKSMQSVKSIIASKDRSDWIDALERNGPEHASCKIRCCYHRARALFALDKVPDLQPRHLRPALQHPQRAPTRALRATVHLPRPPGASHR